MAWDFETDPEFQKKLDWVDAFVREEVEPLDLVLGDPYDKSDQRALADRPAAAAAGEGPRRSGPATSGPSSAARATAR